MPRTTGLGVKGKTTIGGAKHSGAVPKSAGASSNRSPSGTKALYPSGRATNPLVKSVGSIPVSTPKAATRPNALRTPPTR